MRNSFDIRAYANFFKERLWQKKMVLKKQSHFTKHWLEWHNSAVVKELLARADELGSTSGEAVFCFFIVWFVEPDVGTIFTQNMQIFEMVCKQWNLRPRLKQIALCVWKIIRTNILGWNLPKLCIIINWTWDPAVQLQLAVVFQFFRMLVCRDWWESVLPKSVICQLNHLIKLKNKLGSILWNIVCRSQLSVT